MSEGTRYQSIVVEWAKLINAPKEAEDDIDVYAKPRKDHNSMANMYKEVPDKALETQARLSVLCVVWIGHHEHHIEAHLVAQIRRS